MKITFTFLSVCTALFLTSSIAYSQNHYVVQSPDGEEHLLTFDISNGSQVDSIGVQVINGNIDIAGFNGMARDPISADLYVAFKDVNGVRYLGTIAPSTGDITSIGLLSITASSITFDASGTLYAMSGAGSTELFTVNPATAAPTLFHTFASAGNDGEVIGVNTNDGLLYRYTGGSQGDLITLNLTTLVETIVAALANVDTYGGAFYYNEGTDDFTFASGEYFYNLTNTGTLTELSDITALGYVGNFKGIVSVSAASTNELDLDASAFSVYPNPSNGVINIETEEDFKLEVYDVKGSLVQNHDNINTVSIKGSGVYFLKFTTEEGTVTQKVTIK